MHQQHPAVAACSCLGASHSHPSANLCRCPHSELYLISCATAFFSNDLQVQAWQQQTQQASATANKTPTPADATATSSLVVTLTLDSPHEEPAALAILEAMYGVKPITQILSESPCTQQLDIAVLADKLHLPAICAPAVHGLLAACKGSQSSAAAVAQHLASKQHVPGCLLPLVRQLFSSYDGAKDTFPVKALQQVSYAGCCFGCVCGARVCVWGGVFYRILAWLNALLILHNYCEPSDAHVG
jgi:hypothetical protein